MLRILRLENNIVNPIRIELQVSRKKIIVFGYNEDGVLKQKRIKYERLEFWRRKMDINGVFVDVVQGGDIHMTPAD